MSVKKKTKVAVIKEYFGMTARQAMDEIKPLSDSDKLELAQGAAINLGLSKDDVNFPLKNLPSAAA